MSVLSYVRFAFIIIDLVVIIYLLVCRSKIDLNRSFTTLLLGIVLSLVIVLCAVLLSLFLTIPIIMSSMLIVSTIVMFVFTMISQKQHKSELLLAKEEKLLEEKLHQELLKQPEAEVQKMKNILPLGKSILHDTVIAIQKDEDSVTLVSEVVLKKIQEELNADGAVLLLLDDFEDILKVKGYIGYFPPPYMLPNDVPKKKDRIITNFKYAEFALEGNIFGTAFSTGNTLVVNDPSTDPTIVVNGEEDFLQHGSLILSPIIFNDERIGLIAASRNSEKIHYRNIDVEIFDVLCGYSGAALNLANSLKETKEIGDIQNTKSITEKIQKMLLPKTLKKIGNLDVGVYFSQSHGVCSDYYDAIQNQKDRIFLVVADIASKNIESAIIMSMIRALLYLITNTRQTTDAILDWLNKGITGKIGIDHFADITLLTYYPDQKMAEFIGAGNQSMLILRKQTKKVEIYEQKTDPLGVDSNSVYKHTKINIGEGDIIAMYTDGIIETLNYEGNQYGMNALARVLIKNIDLEPKAISKAVKEDINKFVGKSPIHDDQTILIIKPVNR